MFFKKNWESLRCIIVRFGPHNGSDSHFLFLIKQAREREFARVSFNRE